MCIMRKVLPMKVPLIRSYANYAHIFSILDTHGENYYPWVYNHYVQLCVPDDYSIFPVDYMVTRMYTNTPNFFTSRLERKMAVTIKSGILNFIRFAIDNGYYIFMMLEVSHIAAYEWMRFHEPLLYGYDDEKEEIYFADTYMNGKYSEGIATYTEIVNATGDELNWNTFHTTNLGLDVMCMKYRDMKEEFVFNKNTYIHFLNCYINQEDTYNFFGKIPGVTRGDVTPNVCGIGIYNILQKHLQFVREDVNAFIDKRGFYVILEHKKLLEKTMAFLLGECWKEVFPVEWQLVQEEVKNATICLYLCLKYNVTQDVRILNRISEYAIILEQTEKSLFPNLIKIVENSIISN